MKVAVIGSGISGLSASHFLSKKYTVDLFEKTNYFGGHSFTVDIKESSSSQLISLDLGFIVFNEKTYPNLIKFFNDLKISYEKSNMSFAVSVKNSSIEYSGTGLNGVFANKLNFFNFNFLKMIKEIFIFYKKAEELDANNYKDQMLGEFLKSKNSSDYFINFHIIPMVAAIWSMPFSKAKNMPLRLFLNFFINHGLFRLKNRPQWYTVTSRSRVYVNKVLKNISGEYFKNYKVSKISRSESNVRLTIGNEFLDYDHVVLASHADQSLKLLENPTAAEKNILKKFTYVSNVAYLHTDINLMPKKKIAWSSWNSISKSDLSNTCITYWLNNLQNLKSEENYFLTLNPVTEIDEKKIIKKINFTHPYFNISTLKLQKDLPLLQGKKRTWFCGSYFGYGFHEDGLKSSLEMIKTFKI